MKFLLKIKSIFTIKWKCIIILFFFYKLIKHPIKVCLCSIGKQENKYIVQFIEHYRRYGVDKIILYDNNDLNGEKFDFLSVYQKKKFLEIINYRGLKGCQLKAYKECYYRNKNKYNWFLFFDIDEFINLAKFSDIHKFLSQKIFNKCSSIYLNFNTHTDNDLLFYDNRSLFERFPKTFQSPFYCIGKSIIKGNIKNIRFTSSHILSNKLKICNSYGKILKMNKMFCDVPDYKYNFIDHYEFKSTEEFISKLNRGIVRNKSKKNNKYFRLFKYFIINNITLDKIYYIANHTNLNAKYIIKKLKKLLKKNNSKTINISTFF